MTFSIPIFGCIRTPAIYLSTPPNSTQSLHMFAFQFDWKIYFIRFSLCVRIRICKAQPPKTTHATHAAQKTQTTQQSSNPAIQQPTSNNAVNCQSNAACRAFGLQFVKCLSRGFSFGRSASGLRICWLPDFPGIGALNFRQPTPPAPQKNRIHIGWQ